MNFHDVCPHCGAVTTAYTTPMNEGLARVFVKFARARLHLRRPLGKAELRLTNVEYTVFQKLQYFELIRQHERRTTWEMTPKGWAWFLEREPILTPCGHMGNRVLPYEHPAWATHPKPREAIWIADVLNEEWKTYAEYADEKAAANREEFEGSAR